MFFSTYLAHAQDIFTISENGIPVIAAELTEKILALKTFIIVAPEYNGVMPPMLSNATAWMTRVTTD